MKRNVVARVPGSRAPAQADFDREKKERVTFQVAASCAIPQRASRALVSSLLWQRKLRRKVVKEAGLEPGPRLSRPLRADTLYRQALVAYVFYIRGFHNSRGSIHGGAVILADLGEWSLREPDIQRFALYEKNVVAAADRYGIPRSRGFDFAEDVEVLLSGEWARWRTSEGADRSWVDPLRRSRARDGAA